MGSLSAVSAMHPLARAWAGPSGGPGTRQVGLPSEIGRGVLRARSMRLQLRHTWTTVMSKSTFRDVCYTTYTLGDHTGYGEGAPIPRYHESAEGALAAVEALRPLVEGADPFKFAAVLDRIGRARPGDYAAKAAIDLALTDWVTQRLGVPLYRYLGLDPERAPPTSMSIGIDRPEITIQKVREAADFPVLKIKVGLDSDEATLAAVRSVSQQRLRVDANEGWKDREEALRKLKWLAGQNVEFVEQPMAAERIDDQRWLHERSPLPLFADEACLHAEAIPGLSGLYDGIVVKLDKCGGIFPALRMIHVARAHKLKILLGCMVSSSVTITAAAHLASLVDYVDLDGNLLIDNDPFQGVSVEKGRLILPNRPGLGLLPRPASATVPRPAAPASPVPVSRPSSAAATAPATGN
jgi:L-alanine-DL-glutamate epimerase-like enolase superfamily enzyme